MYFGNLVGQLNQGSNNIFIGYETQDYTGFVSYTNYSNTFAIYQASTYNLVNSSDANHNILLGGDFSTGTVGIGTVVPDTYIGSNISATATKLVVLGKVLANAYTQFTGCHNVNINLNDSINIFPGMILSSTGIANVLDINNTNVSVKLSSRSNDKTVFGIYSHKELNEFTHEHIHYVNSLGEGGILVSNYTGEIQNGDYITSCPIPGYGCLQTDDILHSYTVAKCTETIDWSTISENVLCPVDGKMYKSYLAACTYHCG